MRTILLLPLIGTLAAIQAQDEVPQPFRVTTERVVAPVSVFDRNNATVNGIEPFQFHLFDNNKEQNIQVDISYQPISVVICIQANEHVENMLPQIRRIGNLVTPLVIGDQGAAAIISFGSNVKTLQQFTSNPDLITKAVRDIQPGGYSNRMIDAVVEGARMLDKQPVNRRRIMLVIGETRDLASESRAREALIDLQLSNIVFYAVDMSRLLSTLSAPPVQPRPDTQLPTAVPTPAGVPATPTSVQQMYGTNGTSAQFIPLMVELLKDVKAIFKDNPVELFTKGTGGSEFSYYKRSGLEEAITRIGEELHSQYLISYSPSNKLEGGFHQIQVEIVGHPEIKKIQTRPGYWLAASNQ